MRNREANPRGGWPVRSISGKGGSTARSKTVGLSLIVGYKLAKAGVELLLGVLVLSLASAGHTHALHSVVTALRNHATEAWSIAAAQWLANAATGRHLRVVALAAFLDAVLSLVEGWSLHRRYPWSRWLIVGATSCLLPFEAVALVHHLRAGRVAIMVVNLLLVGYLIRVGVVVEAPTGGGDGAMAAG
jgi:uncharacterized membrane protein (DUF2068 family)